MIRENILDPGKLRGCIEGGTGMDDKDTARELTGVARKMAAIDHERSGDRLHCGRPPTH